MDEILNSRLNQLVLRSDEKYSSDSFERFGDDLCELLLTFLPLSEKFRFECVSKQWKNLVFNKVFVLDKNDINFMKPLGLRLMKSNYYYFDENAFEIVVKKCVFIKHIVFETFVDFIENGNIFEIMANNCRYLEAFEYCIQNINYYDIDFNDEFNEFIDKCGIKLKSLKINCKPIIDNSIEILLKKTPNIRKLYLNNCSIFINTNDDNFLRDLKEVKFYSTLNNDPFEGIKALSDRYYKQIESFSGSIDNFCVYNFSQQLSRFENLKSLELSINWSLGSFESTECGLKMIANNCLQLKHLSLTINMCPFITQPFIGDSIMSLTQFKALNSLSLKINAKMDFILCHFKHFSNVRNLSKLSLNGFLLRNEYFEDIHLYLSELRAIRLIDMKAIGDKCLEYLSKIPNLSTLKLINTSVTLDGIQKLITSSLKLNSIEAKLLNVCFEDEVIDSLIVLSKRTPKVMLKFLFELFVNHNCSEIEIYNEFIKLRKLQQILKLPKNLSINWWHFCD